MVVLKTRIFILVVWALAFFTSCEKGGNYVNLELAPARIYVIAHVYNTQTGTDATAFAKVSNVGYYEFPQPIEQGTPWVVAAEYKDLSASDTLKLPSVQKGEIAYCHVNLFLCSADQSMIYTMESVAEESVYVPNAQGYSYKDFIWLQNPTQNLFYTYQNPEMQVTDQVQNVVYNDDLNWKRYNNLLSKLTAPHYLELESMSFWGSGWSLNRLMRTSSQMQYRYALLDKLSGEQLLSFTLNEGDAMVVYGMDEIPYPEYADFYVKGWGYNASDAINSMFDVPGRAGGGIFYDD